MPSGLSLTSLSAGGLFGAARVDANADYARVLRFLLAGSLLAQLAALAGLAAVRRGLAARLPGPEIARAGILGALVVLVTRVAALPFGVTGLWWRRREGVARAGYGRWLVDQLVPLAAELALGAVVAVALVLLARRLGRRWWLAAWAALCVLAAAWVLLGPLVLAPRLEPLRERELAAEIRRLARVEGVGDVRVEVRQARTRTRAVNAEAIGVWPSTTVVLWDTLLEPNVGRGEVRFLVAHGSPTSPGTTPRRASPGSRSSRCRARGCSPARRGSGERRTCRSRRSSRRCSRSASRRSRTRSPAATSARRTGRRCRRRGTQPRRRWSSGASPALSRTDPAPPRLWHLLAGTHPTLVERVELARVSSGRAGAPRGGPGSP